MFACDPLRVSHVKRVVDLTTQLNSQLHTNYSTIRRADRLIKNLIFYP